jgi:hypothetical protein
LTATPTTNVLGAGGAGGAVAIILIWLVNAFTGLEIPDPVAQAITALCIIVAGYIIPSQTMPEQPRHTRQPPPGGTPSGGGPLR